MSLDCSGFRWRGSPCRSKTRYNCRFSLMISVRGEALLVGPGDGTDGSVIYNRSEFGGRWWWFGGPVSVTGTPLASSPVGLGMGGWPVLPSTEAPRPRCGRAIPSGGGSNRRGSDAYARVCGGACVPRVCACRVRGRQKKPHPNISATRISTPLVLRLGAPVGLAPEWPLAPAVRVVGTSVRRDTRFGPHLAARHNHRRAVRVL